MDDDFVKQVSRYQTVKELEEALSKEIRDRKERESQKQFERELLNQLKAACPFEVPRVLIREEAKRVAEERHFQLKLLGLPESEIGKKISQDEEELQREAEARVKNSLLLERIAETEKIEVRPEEIDGRIRSLSENLGRNERERQGDLVNASLRRRIAGEVLFEKALSVIVENAQIKEVS
ncbi:MAG: hypothetical protein ABH845_05195 [Candidatus Omnitrophota bacterium]